MKDKPDHHDAELVLKLYDLRRETVMRESRNSINAKFWPKNYDEFLAVASDIKHPMNAAWRQVSTYWEMAYSFARHGVVNADFFAENCGEGLFFFAKIKPYLEQYRKDIAPTAFTNSSWLVANSGIARTRMELLESRVKTMLESMK